MDQMDRAIAKETTRAQSVLSAQYQQEIRRLRGEARAASKKRASLDRTIGNTRSALAATNRAQVRLNILERKAQAVRATYEAYLNRYQETTTTLGAEQPDARIVSLASIPQKPAQPKLLMNLILGGLFGLAFAFSATTAWAMLDPSLSTPAEIERLLDIEALPSQPSFISVSSDAGVDNKSLPPEEFVLTNPGSVSAEQLRKLLAAIPTGNGNGGAEILAITSALPGEGKTTTTLCLGRLAALGGTKTIVVDCDIHHRSLSQFIQPPADTGLIEYLRGNIALTGAIRHDKPSGLDILPLSIALEPADRWFKKGTMNGLMAELRQRYDLVIIDTPPVLPLADAAMIAGLADATMILCQWRSKRWRKPCRFSLRVTSISRAWHFPESIGANNRRRVTATPLSISINIKAIISNRTARFDTGISNAATNKYKYPASQPPSP